MSKSFSNINSIMIVRINVLSSYTLHVKNLSCGLLTSIRLSRIKRSRLQRGLQNHYSASLVKKDDLFSDVVVPLIFECALC